MYGKSRDGDATAGDPPAGAVSGSSTTIEVTVGPQLPPQPPGALPDHLTPAHAPGELVTPTGVALGWHEPESPEWFEQRRDGVSATDLPKLLGLTKWGNPLSVFLDKRGELPRDEAGEAAQWGQLLEDVVAEEWARRAGVVVSRVGVLANVDHPWQRASLDRLVHGCPDAPDGLCAVEVKTRSAYVADRWRDDVPDDVYAQVAWQVVVTGLPHVHVVALLGGQRLTAHRYDPDPGVQAQCLAAAEEFRGHLTSGVPPVVEPDALLLDLLDRLHPERVGTVEVPGDLRDEARRLVEVRRAALRSKTEADAVADTAKAGLVQLLGDAEAATVDGVELFRYRPGTRKSTAWREVVKTAPPAWRDELVELVGQHTTTTTTRSLILADPPAEPNPEP